MPPSTKYDREQIVQAALEIAKEHGLSGISTRAVAKRLGCSVAPIYQNFATVDALIDAVAERVFAMSGELLAAEDGPNPFENMGRASLAFARNHPALFRELALEPNPYMPAHEDVEEAMLSVLAEDEELSSLDESGLRRLFLKMRIFQLGLSAMVANGTLPGWMDDDAVERLLMETGEEIATAMMERSRKNEQQ